MRNLIQKTSSRKANSPFRYPGGKFYARKLILECIPQHSKYCEPFVGGGSIFFAKEPLQVNILNDKDSVLVNCYIQIRDHVESLIEKLKGIPATREFRDYYKNEFEPKDDLEKAMRWYYLNRTSYCGIMVPYGGYWGYVDGYSMPPENWPSHLRTCSDKLQGVVFQSQDFEELIETLEDDFFLFVDPPYFHEISPRILFALADRRIGNNQNGALLHEGSFSFVLSLVTISQKFLYENNTNNLLQIESL